MGHESEGFEPDYEPERWSPAITARLIEDRLGYRLSVAFPTFEADKAGIIEYHEELDRLEESFGAENVFGSLFYENEKLLLGVFVNTAVIPTDTASPPLS